MIELVLVVASAQASTLTFSRLLVQQDGGVLPAQAPEAFGPHFLDLMRGLGLDARGADDALFGKQDAAGADFVLGGTVLGVVTRPGDPAQVEVQVEWKLLDRQRDAVVYSVVTRGYASKAAALSELGATALDDALCRALIRPKLRQALDDEADAPLVIDTPDAPRLVLAAGASAEHHARGYDRTARSLRVAGAASLATGALLVVPTWLATENARWVSDTAWAGAVTLNTGGWLLAATGSVALVTGFVLHTDAGPSVALLPTGVAVSGRF